MISGAERDAEPNVSLAGDGFDAVNDAKDLVEASCPGIVSCADIMAILARDAVVLVRSSHHMLSCFLFLLSSSSRLVIMSSHLSLTFEFIFLMFEVLSIFKSTKEKRKLCHALREALTSECPSY